MATSEHLRAQPMKFFVFLLALTGSVGNITAEPNGATYIGCDSIQSDAIVGEPVLGDEKCLANCNGAGYHTSTRYCGGLVTAGREYTYLSFVQA
ncbi:hypothetical protein CI238_02596 [Colletotrichum incanum]|uniref:WSC domain-containing protein n=1 Tax=Colletotrichum incanum TaxID=1573173 RepID=A0A161YA23_COLIC|nr:hypothetical protein CI238_02596 [Colletotrichum incanum]